MIYVDSSVALAQLLDEDQSPGEAFWRREDLVASRLLEYEVWNRVNLRSLARSHGDDVRLLIGRLGLLELAPPVLTRALQSFPVPVRTLDSLHLASIEFLRQLGQEPELASYDHRLNAAARAVGITIAPL
jgi:hypothetical protein